MSSRLSRFTDASLAKHAVSSDASLAGKKDDGGYADWVIVAIHGLHEYLDLPYRRLLDVPHGMKWIVKKLDFDRGRGSDKSVKSFRKRLCKISNVPSEYSQYRVCN